MIIGYRKVGSQQQNRLNVLLDKYSDTSKGIPPETFPNNHVKVCQLMTKRSSFLSPARHGWVFSPLQVPPPPPNLTDYKAILRRVLELVCKIKPVILES